MELPEVAGVSGISGGKVTAFFNWADCRCPDCTLGNLMVGVSEGVGVGVTGPLPPAFWGGSLLFGATVC